MVKWGRTGLALFGPLKGALSTALSGDPRQRDAALLTFVVAASGVDLGGVSGQAAASSVSACWGTGWANPCSQTLSSSEADSARIMAIAVQ